MVIKSAAFESEIPNPVGWITDLYALRPRLADEGDRLPQHGERQAEQDELGDLFGELGGDSMHFKNVMQNLSKSYNKKIQEIST